MPSKTTDGLQSGVDDTDIRPSSPSTIYGRGREEELLKRILNGLTDCRAELAILNSPWVARVPTGWFYIYYLRAGICQLMQGIHSTPLEMQTGDVVMLPRCREHRLRDSYTTEWSDSNQVSWFDGTPRIGTDRANASNFRAATNVVVCRFPKPNKEINLLLQAFPESLVFKKRNPEFASGPESTITALEQEIAQFPASQPIVEHLVKALILQTARTSDSRRSSQHDSGETVSTDRMIAKAVGLMHSRPETAWTVAMLATRVGVSRSTFAARFVDQIGMTPLNYLRRERMQQAAELLCDETLGIKEISILVGYSSESAFSNTFKQWFGMTPGLFRRDRLQ